MLTRLPIIILFVFILAPPTIIWMQRTSRSIPYILEIPQAPNPLVNSVLVSNSYEDPEAIGTSLDNEAELASNSIANSHGKIDEAAHSGTRTQDDDTTGLSELGNDRKSGIIQVGLLAKDAPKHAADPQVEFGKKWGYTTEMLQDCPHIKDTSVEFLTKQRLHLLSILSNEMAKSTEERAKWLLYDLPNKKFVYKKMLTSTYRSFNSQHTEINQDIPLSTFLPPRDFPDIHFLAVKHEGKIQPGIFLIRISEWAQRLLTQAIAKSQLKPDDGHEKREVPDALDTYLHKTGFSEHVLYVPEEWFQNANTKEPAFVGDSESDERSPYPTEEAGEDSRGESKDSSSPYPEELKRSSTAPSLTSSSTDRRLIIAPLRPAVKAFWSRLRKARNVIREVNWTLGSYVARKPHASPPRLEGAMQKLSAAHAALLEVMYQRAYAAEEIEAATGELVRRLFEARSSSG